VTFGISIQIIVSVILSENQIVRIPVKKVDFGHCRAWPSDVRLTDKMTAPPRQYQMSLIAASLPMGQAQVFCYLPRLEHVLREFPALQIVTTGTQRGVMPLALLVQRFVPDIAARIVGTTSIIEILNAGDVATNQHREILVYLSGSDTHWLALDDDASRFPSGCAELVLYDDGFQETEEQALRTALEKFVPEQLPTYGLRAYIIKLAHRHGVSYVKTPSDQLAQVITNLSDDDVEMDDVERLIIALERAGVISSEQVVPLHIHYLREKFK
jgi:hypothetical protein